MQPRVLYIKKKWTETIKEKEQAMQTTVKNVLDLSNERVRKG